MKIVITGGGGFIGLKLAKALLARGTLAGDISDPGFTARAIAADTTSIFHLAAVVSGAAEADFDLGMRVNLQGMRNLLEQARKCVHPPRLVFASSVAAFGGDLPEVLDDSTTPAPQTSYGSQKVI